MDTGGKAAVSGLCVSRCAFVCLGGCLCVYGLAPGAVFAELNQRLGRGAVWKWEIRQGAKEGFCCVCVSMRLCSHTQLFKVCQCPSTKEFIIYGAY